MDFTKVALSRCCDYDPQKISQALQRQFELLGGLGKFVSSGDSVLIKPNLIAPKSRRHAVQTDPVIIIELAKLLKDFGAKPFVADSPAWATVFECIEKLELCEPLKKLSVPVKQLDKPKNCYIGEKREKVKISSVALDADVIINLPKFKAHQQLVATFAVKNMFGCVSGKRKALLHYTKGKSEESFCRFLIDIYKFLNPAINIIDGIIAMEGSGPINGTPKELGWLIGGTDGIACEMVCSKLINAEPMEFPIIRTAKRTGFGCCDLSKIEITGDELAGNICLDFKPTELTPIRFSLFQVTKSICKQIILLIKSALKIETKTP